MIENIRDEEKKKSAIIKENFQQLKEELKDKALEEMEIIQADMSSKKLGIYDALENLFQRFMRNSKDKFNKYTQLLEKNTNNSKSIEETIKKITRTKNKIKLVSLKIIQMEKEFEDKNNKIRRENDEIAENFLKLKSEMFKFRNKENKKLTRLVCDSKNTVKRLTEICKQGEKILRTTELCRKLEFEEEKVVTHKEETVNLDSRWLSLFPDGSLNRFTKLKNYLKRFNKVLLDKIAIEKENEQIKEHNQLLKDRINKFHRDTQINQQTVKNRDNTLLKCTGISNSTRDTIYSEAEKENYQLDINEREMLEG